MVGYLATNVVEILLHWKEIVKCLRNDVNCLGVCLARVSVVGAGSTFPCAPGAISLRPTWQASGLSGLGSFLKLA